MFIQTVTAAAIKGSSYKTTLHNLLYAACVLNVPNLATLIRSALLVAPDKEMYDEQPGFVNLLYVLIASDSSEFMKACMHMPRGLLTMSYLMCDIVYSYLSLAKSD